MIFGDCPHLATKMRTRSELLKSLKRAYKKYGKVHISDDDWTLITDGNEGDYNFFKVTVEMK